MKQTIEVFNFGFPYTEEELKMLQQRMKWAASEMKVVRIAAQMFNQKFILAAPGTTGYDVISEDGKIKIEVKYRNGSESFMKKYKTIKMSGLANKHIADYIYLIFEPYQGDVREALLPVKELLKTNVNRNKETGKPSEWWFDMRFENGDNQEENTKFFLKHEVKNHNFSEKKHEKDLVL
tara:strand:- start:239 stop:775 length:537 start_codon:yes stop_codon:yes gene_type:complete